MAERLYRFVALAALAFWIGGTTFYALVVVPTGTPSARTLKLSAASWSALAVTLVALFWLHPRVASYLDHADRYVTDAAAFYEWHRAYLLVTALQWLAGLVHLWSLTSVAHCRPRASTIETHS